MKQQFNGSQWTQSPPASPGVPGTASGPPTPAGSGSSGAPDSPLSGPLAGLRGSLRAWRERAAKNSQNPMIPSRLTTDPYSPSDLITPQHMEQFERDGFVVIPNVVPEGLRNRAMREINRTLSGKGPTNIHPEFEKLKKVSACPELTISKFITDLIRRSPALGCAHSIIGAGTHRTHFGQIALRFPGDLCIPSGEVAAETMGDIGRLISSRAGRFVSHLFQKAAADSEFANQSFDQDYTVIPKWETFWHLDGWPNREFPSPVGEDGVSNFTMLVGVMLSDATAPLSGNLTVFPGSHKIIQDVIRQAGGPEQLFSTKAPPQPAETPDPQSESVRLLRQMVGDRLGQPTQISAKAGDLVLVHYQVAHTIAPNTSPNIRYCIYFRLSHTDHPPETYRPQTLTDIWVDYPSMRRFIGQRTGQAQAQTQAQDHSPPPSAPLPQHPPPTAPHSAPLSPIRQGQVTLESGRVALEAGDVQMARALFEQGLGDLLQSPEAAGAEGEKLTQDFLECIQKIPL